MSRLVCLTQQLGEGLALVVKRAGLHAKVGSVDRAAHRGFVDARQDFRRRLAQRKAQDGKAGGLREQFSSVQHRHRFLAFGRHVAGIVPGRTDRPVCRQWLVKSPREA